MITFKEQQEKTAQANTKEFEDKIMYACLGQDIGAGEREREAKLAAAHYIEKYGIAEKNFKPKKSSGYPGTRPSQPKADIALYGKGQWLSLSVKLRGGFVLQSAENPEEFRGLYFAAMSLYEERFGGSTEAAAAIDKWKKEIDHIADNIIGSNSGVSKKDYMVKNKPRRPVWDDVEKKYEAAIKSEKSSEIIATLKETKELIIQRLEEDNKKFAGEFNKKSKEMEQHCRKVLTEELYKDANFERCILWESLTGYVKFNRPSSFYNLKDHGPYANFMISPTGLYDIRDMNSSIIDKVKANQWYELQTMPVPGKVRVYIEQIRGRKVRNPMTLDDAIETLQKVKFSSKLKSKIFEDYERDIFEEMDTIIEELETIEEGKLDRLFLKVTDKVKTFFKKVFSGLLRIYESFKDTVRSIISGIVTPVTFSEALMFLNLAPTGGKFTVTIP